MVDPGPQGAGADASAAFAQLATIVLGTDSLDSVLGRVATVAVETIPGTSEASVTVLEGGRARSVAFTSPLAAQLDERQYASGWGPCLDAAESGETVTVDIARAADVYADFAAAAQRAGVVSSASVGLPVADRMVGGLNLYSTTGVFDDTALAMAGTFAGYAAVAVANAARYASAEDRVDNMLAAMESRAVIEQAKGIVMATQGCSPDAAFEVLVRTSQQRNTKLREVAAEIVRSARSSGQDLGETAS